MKNKLLNIDILFYLVIAFGFSWILWGSEILFINNIYNSQPIKLIARYHNFGAWGPLIAALLITYKTKNVDGLKSLVKQTFNRNYSKKWLLPTFLLFPTIIGLPILLLILFNQPVPNLTFLQNPVVAVIAFFVIFVNAGPLQEEYGWRGILQDKLENKLNPLKASIVTGFIWGIWHVPLYYLPDQGFYYDKPIWGLLLSTILISVLFGWIYNNTKRNLLLMLLFHTTYNFSFYLFPTLESDLAGQLYFLFLILSVGVVVYKGGIHLTSKKLE